MQAPSDGFLPQIRLSTYSKRQIKEPLHVQDISSIACMTGALRAKQGERDISRRAPHEGKSALFFSSPRIALRARVALRAKYRVRPACLIKRLSCRLFQAFPTSACHTFWCDQGSSPCAK